jgi:proteasome lid subunit RPN8/RPN11
LNQNIPDSRMNPPVYWPDESLPLAIYCAPGVLMGLEILATDGLLAMPRTGLGIGGLLLGRQSGERLEILKTVAISCSHAMGPSFVLTPEEIAEAKASEDGVDEGCALVGWYCSKPNGRMVLSENDEALFDVLCGERAQVALLIRPSHGQVTLAAFAIRGDGQNGNRFRLGAQGELVTPEQMPDDPEQDLAAEHVVPFVDSAPPDLPHYLPHDLPPDLLKKTAHELLEPLPDQEPWVMPAAPRGSTLFGVSMEQMVAERKRRWQRRLLLLIILIAVLAVAYLTRSQWLPAVQPYFPESGISK